MPEFVWKAHGGVEVRQEDFPKAAAAEGQQVAGYSCSFVEAESPS
jgi:hypothetical protein